MKDLSHNKNNLNEIYKYDYILNTSFVQCLYDYAFIAE